MYLDERGCNSLKVRDKMSLDHLLDESFSKIYENIEQLSFMAEKQKDITYVTYLKYQQVKKDLVEELKALEFLYKGSFPRG